MQNPDQMLSAMIQNQQCDDLWFDHDTIAKKRKEIQGIMKGYCDNWTSDGTREKRKEETRLRALDSTNDVMIIGD